MVRIVLACFQQEGVDLPPASVLLDSLDAGGKVVDVLLEFSEPIFRVVRAL